MTAFSGSQQANLKGNRVAAFIVKLAKKLGLGASELFDQVEFCLPHPYVFEPVHCALEPISVETVHAASLETVFGIASSPCCFPQAYVDSACVNIPVLDYVKAASAPLFVSAPGQQCSCLSLDPYQCLG